MDMTGLPIPKPTSSRLTRARDRDALHARLRVLRDTVLTRDGYRCRVCVAAVHPKALALARRAQVHHLEPRSRAPERIEDPDNLVTVCVPCHEDIRLHRIEQIGLHQLTVQFIRKGAAMRQVRQGDVFLHKIKTRERQGAPITDQGRVILAYGEVTGHAHEVVAESDVATTSELPAAQLFEEPDGRRFLFIERGCTLVHQEHGAIALEPGCYEVTRQREYSPEEIRQVAD